MLIAVKRKCNHCRGTGRTLVEFKELKDKNAYVEDPCLICEGTGLVEEYIECYGIRIIDRRKNDDRREITDNKS